MLFHLFHIAPAEIRLNRRVRVKFVERSTECFEMGALSNNRLHGFIGD